MENSQQEKPKEVSFQLSVSSVDIVLYKEKSSHETNIIFQLKHLNQILHRTNVDLLWNLTWTHKNLFPLRPDYMQLLLNVHSKTEHKKGNIAFLIKIHLNFQQNVMHQFNFDLNG